jgi:beta-galactosidase
MNRFFHLVAALCLGLLSTLASASARTSAVINRDWVFTLGNPVGAQAAEHDTSTWGRADLPHSFSEPYFLGTGFYVGHGWYRRNLDLPASSQGKRITLEFDGVFQEAVIWVNGQKASRHVGGYTGFSIDITPYVKTGRNLLAVHVNNEWNARVAPRAGEHVFSGGIYRNVRLVMTDPVHVAWYGTFVTTPQVSDDKATVRVQTELKNSRTDAVKVELVSEVLDASGKRLARHRSERLLPANGMVNEDQILPEIGHPRLWSPESPYLYKLVSHVSVNGKPVDRFETPFGIRTVKFTADQGFFLNGKHYYFVGANVHQDRRRRAARRADGQGRRLRLHPRLALPALAGLLQGHRRAGPAVLVGGALLGHRRIRRRRQLAVQCLPAQPG